MANRITAWAIDCQDPARMAQFWTAVLDWVVTDTDEEGVVSIKASPDAASGIDLVPVADGPKRTKNRIHLDLSPTDRDQDAELGRLLALGARAVDIGQGEVSWHVLADPEGNEFCLLRGRVDAADREAQATVRGLGDGIR
jgi:predicted enzyme related to lactoylglutathione lyase